MKCVLVAGLGEAVLLFRSGSGALATKRFQFHPVRLLSQTPALQECRAKSLLLELLNQHPGLPLPSGIQTSGRLKAEGVAVCNGCFHPPCHHDMAGIKLRDGESSPLFGFQSCLGYVQPTASLKGSGIPRPLPAREQVPHASCQAILQCHRLRDRQGSLLKSEMPTQPGPRAVCSCATNANPTCGLRPNSPGITFSTLARSQICAERVPQAYVQRTGNRCQVAEVLSLNVHERLSHAQDEVWFRLLSFEPVSCTNRCAWKLECLERQ